MEGKITKRAVDQLSATGLDVMLWDTEVKGFGVRCRASGAKNYVMKMRTCGRQRWIIIGRHGSPPGQLRAHGLRLFGFWD